VYTFTIGIETGVKLMRPLAVAASGESNAHLSIHKKINDEKT